MSKYIPKSQESVSHGRNSDPSLILESKIDPLSISWEKAHIIISPTRERFVIFRGIKYDS